MTKKKKEEYISIQDRILKFLDKSGKTLEQIYLSFNGNLHKNTVKHAIQILLDRSLINKKLNKDGIRLYSI